MQLYEYDLTMQSFYVSQIHIRYFILLQTSERMDIFFPWMTARYLLKL